MLWRTSKRLWLRRPVIDADTLIGLGTSGGSATVSLRAGSGSADPAGSGSGRASTSRHRSSTVPGGKPRGRGQYEVAWGH